MLPLVDVDVVFFNGDAVALLIDADGEGLDTVGMLWRQCNGIHNKLSLKNSNYRN
jgi:hypothetical protein